jgi:hypothetical protein
MGISAESYSMDEQVYSYNNFLKTNQIRNTQIIMK